MADLKKQIAYFEKHRERLAEEHEGKQALVYDGQIDVYSTTREAVRAGLAKYGDKDFLVRRISKVNEPIFMPTLEPGVILGDPRL